MAWFTIVPVRSYGVKFTTLSYVGTLGSIPTAGLDSPMARKMKFWMCDMLSWRMEKERNGFQ